MRLFYLDPGLTTQTGHHAAHCRLITREFRSRGYDIEVFGYVDADAAVTAEFHARPHFRHSTYVLSDGDPLCGWLSGFDRFTRTTVEDLMRLDEIAPTDLVYLSSARAIELSAITAWMAMRAPGTLPFVVVDFCVPPGIEFERTETAIKIRMPDPRQDAGAVLLRFASTTIMPDVLSRLRLVTFSATTTEQYRHLLSRRVDTVPMLFEASTSRRNRVGKRPIVISVLGHQQRGKGYQMLPEVLRLLLAARPDVRFFIHNADPDAAIANDPTGLGEAQHKLREIAATDARVALSEGPAGSDRWSPMLEGTDLMLCPYSPRIYRAGFSAVAVEAIANGIPVVGPAGTGVEELINEFGGAGTVFERQEPEAIATATIDLLDDFDRYAALAHRAAAIWPTRYGPRPMVDAVLALLTS